MNVGELVGYMDIDDSQWSSGLSNADRQFDKFTSSVDDDLNELERSFEREAAAFVEEMERGFQELDDVVEEAFSEAADAAQKGGEEVGEKFVRGADGKLRTARGKFVAAGREAGEGFGDSAGGAAESRLGGAAKGLGGMLVKAGGFLLAGIAAGEMLVDGFTKALEAEVSSDLLTAQLGATAEESARMGEVAGNLYADAYGESLGEVNEAIKGVIHNIGGMREASEDDLQRISAKAMDLAKVLGEEVGPTSRAVGKMLKTGMAKDADEAFDILTRGAQLGANEAEDLLDTFSEYSTMFRDIGLDGKTAMGLISQGLQAGARDSDTVADALKEFAIRAQDASTTSAEGFKAIGLNAEEMTKIFAEGGPKASEALDTVLDRLRDMDDPVARNAAAVALFGTKAEDLGDALFALDPSQAVERLGQVEGATKRAGDEMADNAATKLEAFKRGLQEKVVDFLGNTVIPKVEEFIDQLKLSGVSERIEEVVGKVKDTFGKIVDDVKAWAEEHKATIDSVVERAQGAFDSITGAVESFVELVGVWWDIFGERFLGVLSNTFENAYQFIQGFFDVVGGIFEVGIGILTGDWDRAWEGMQQITGGATEMQRSIIDMFLGNLLSAMGVDYEEMKRQARETWDSIVQWVRERVDWVKGAVDRLSDIPGKIGEWFRQASVAAAIKLDELVEWVRGLPGRAIAALGDLGGKLYNAGRDLVQGMINGITSKIQDLANKAADMANRALDAAKRALGIASPSKVFREIGQFTADGFVQGLTAGIPMAEAAAARLADSVAMSGGARVAPAGGGSFDSSGQGDRPLLNIENAHFDRDHSPEEIADDLDWKMRGAGR